MMSKMESKSVDQKNVVQKRSYNMSKRAESAAQTERLIFESAAKLWQERPFTEITLDAIAEQAGVSVRTVIRKYGSKEGLYEIGIQNQSEVQGEREKADIGDIEGALKVLLKDYESYGAGIVRLLAVEEQIKAAKKVLSAGREYHRQWCEKIFQPYLPEVNDKEYEEILSAFVAATDIYLWKLLRLDLGYSKAKTMRTFKRLVEGLVKL